MSWVGGLSTYTYNIHTYVCIYYIYSLPLLSAYFMSSFKIHVNFSHLQTDNKIRQSTGRKQEKNNLNKLPQIQRQLKKSGLCSFYCGQMIIHQLQQNPYGWRRSAGVELEVSRQVVKSGEHTHTKQARTHAHPPTPRSHTRLVTVLVMSVKVGNGGRRSRRRRSMRMRGGEEGRVALVVNLDCFLQVGVATSLWSFVEMIQP